jgi:hypothetical protein
MNVWLASAHPSNRTDRHDHHRSSKAESRWIVQLDVNEELVRRYFELKGYFVRTNVRYRYRADKGTGWSDIDLCVLHPRTGDAAAVEVKGWHTGPVTPSYLKEWPSMFYFTRPEASRAVEALLGKSSYRRVLVMSKVADRGGTRSSPTPAIEEWRSSSFQKSFAS